MKAKESQIRIRKAGLGRVETRATEVNELKEEINVRKHSICKMDSIIKF